MSCSDVSRGFFAQLISSARWVSQCVVSWEGLFEWCEMCHSGRLTSWNHNLPRIGPPAGERFRYSSTISVAMCNSVTSKITHHSYSPAYFKKWLTDRETVRIILTYRLLQGVFVLLNGFRDLVPWCPIVQLLQHLSIVSFWQDEQCSECTECHRLLLICPIYWTGILSKDWMLSAQPWLQCTAPIQMNERTDVSLNTGLRTGSILSSLFLVQYCSPSFAVMDNEG